MKLSRYPPAGCKVSAKQFAELMEEVRHHSRASQVYINVAADERSEQWPWRMLAMGIGAEYIDRHQRDALTALRDANVTWNDL